MNEIAHVLKSVDRGKIEKYPMNEIVDVLKSVDRGKIPNE
jgi:hypothetical protein